MNTKQALFASTSILLLHTAATAQTLTAISDATLLQNAAPVNTDAASADAEDNFGGRAEVIIGSNDNATTAPRHGLFRFDVSSLAAGINLGRIVTSATFTLFERPGRDGANGSNTADFSIYALVPENENWVEGTSGGSGEDYSAEAGSVSNSYLAAPSVFQGTDGTRWFSQGGGDTEDSGLPTPSTLQFGTDTGEVIGTGTFQAVAGTDDTLVIELDIAAVQALLPVWLASGTNNAGLIIQGVGNVQLFFESIEGDAEAAGGPSAATLEIEFLTVPGDTDLDGIVDGNETNNGPDSYVSPTDTGTDPALFDTDGDGLSDGDEIDTTIGTTVFTDPTLADTDGDMLNDKVETDNGLNPNMTDTDEDGINDFDEFNGPTDPLLKDTDGDGVEDFQEGLDGTNPALSDSDSDGFGDGEEKDAGTDPNLASSRPQLTPIAYWPLDQTEGTETIDALGGVVATWANVDAQANTPNNLVWSTAGRINGAAELQGTNDDNGNFFEVADITRLAENGVEGLTISAWIRPDLQGDVAYNGVFMTRTEGSIDTNYGIALESVPGNIDYRAANLALDSPDGSVLRSVQDGDFGPLENWYHVAMTVDLATQTHKAYLNGEEVDTAVVDGILDLDGQGYRIGADGATLDNNRDFDGLIDDITIFDKSISKDSIKAIYNGGTDSMSVAQVFGFFVPGDVLRITDISVVDDDVILVFPELRAGKAYEVRSTTDLSLPFSSWTLLAPFEDGSLFTDIDGATGADRRFYAILEVDNAG